MFAASIGRSVADAKVERVCLRPMIDFAKEPALEPEPPEAEEVRPGNDLPPIRWSLYQASREFGVSRTTLRRKLVAAGVLAGPDGCYGTKAICSALFGDLPAARLRGLQAAFALDELKLERLKGALLDRRLLAEAIDKILATLKTIILPRAA